MIFIASNIKLIAFEKDIDSTLYLRIVLAYVFFIDGLLHVIFGSVCFASIKSYHLLLLKKKEDAIKNKELEANRRVVDIESVIKETELKLQRL